MIWPAVDPPHAIAHGELQYSALSTYLAQVEFGCAETESERAAEVFDMIQLSAFQSVIESGAETICDQMGRYLESDFTRCGILIGSGASSHLLLNIAALKRLAIPDKALSALHTARHFDSLVPL